MAVGRTTRYLRTMSPPHVSLAVDIGARALLLRRQVPRLSAVQVLDEVMHGHHGRWIDFGELALPPAPFALLVAEAFDTGMLPCDWAGLMRRGSPPRVREVLLQIWADEVWPKFRVRYSLYRVEATDA